MASICGGNSKPLVAGTRLTLWDLTSVTATSPWARPGGIFVSLDVLDHLLSGTPIGRMVGPEAMKFGGWQRLNKEYAKQFGIETPDGPSQKGRTN